MVPDGGFEQSPSPIPRRRLVVLGASNVIRGAAVAFETARLAWGGPVDVLAAIGHGRSFGMPNRVFGRTLPGILQCDLWTEWRDRPPCPTAALITDIGNDILYGIPAPQIADWVEECLRRLEVDCERIVLTELPLESIARLGPRRFRLLRSLIFPSSRISRDDALQRAHDVNRRLVDLAHAHNAVIIRPQLTWYGFDPIHIRNGYQPAAWQCLLAALSACPSIPAARPSWRESYRWWSARPKHREIFGFVQQQPQPWARLADGTCLSLY